MAITSCRSILRCLTLVFVVFATTGCGNNLEGTYTPQGEGLGGLIESILIKSGGKVEITGMGMTKEGTYEVEGDKVKITIAGDTTILTRDDSGCLDGGGLIGKFCKSDAKATKSEKQSGNASAPSGVYESKMPDDTTFALEFLKNGNVKMTMTENGVADVTDGKWVMNGEQITIQSPEGMPMNLRRSGNTLVADMGGMTMTFVKK